MTTSSAADVGAQSAEAGRAASGQGIAILVIAGAQLMVALDVTIMNIALPHIQTALHFSRPSLAWVIDAYTLVFGGLMLLGGLAGSAGLLIAARAAQGVGGAMASAVTSPAQLLTHTLAHGWGTAFAAGAGFAALALLVAAAVVRVPAGEINPAHAH